MLKLLLLLGALALAVAAKAHSVVPTARGGVPKERVVILPGKGEIKTYKAVPGKGQLGSEDVPGPSEVTIRPTIAAEEDYEVDEGGSGGYENRGGRANPEDEYSADDDELPMSVKQDGRSGVSAAEAGILVSDQEDVGVTTGPAREESLISTTKCLVSKRYHAAEMPE